MTTYQMNVADVNAIIEAHRRFLADAAKVFPAYSMDEYYAAMREALSTSAESWNESDLRRAWAILGFLRAVDGAGGRIKDVVASDAYRTASERIPFSLPDAMRIFMKSYLDALVGHGAVAGEIQGAWDPLYAYAESVGVRHDYS